MVRAFGDEYYCRKFAHYSVKIKFGLWDIELNAPSSETRSYETFIIGDYAFTTDPYKNVTRVFESEGHKDYTFLYFVDAELVKIKELLTLKRLRAIANNPGLMYTL